MIIKIQKSQNVFDNLFKKESIYLSHLILNISRANNTN